MFKPDSYKEIYGQDHIVKTLENMDFGGKSIFLEGYRGTGKTSIAKIIANQFSDSVHNIHHINCGEKVGKDRVVEYIKEFNDSSIFGKNKCYIFDEPQELHHTAMNALLVPTENLRKNVLVILCSMEPEKVRKALSDRFIIFKTRPLDDKTAMDFLNYVCNKAQMYLDKFKKVMIIKKCDGNPRLIVNAIPKIVHIDDKKVIEYLLNIHSIVEEDDDVLLLFKTLLSKKSWAESRGLLNKLLKKKTASSIRVGLMNLAGGGLLKGFGDEKRLVQIYNILKDARDIPEKASLATAIAQLYF